MSNQAIDTVSIEFTNLPKRKKPYAGANGGKIAIVYNATQELLLSSGSIFHVWNTAKAPFILFRLL